MILIEYFKQLLIKKTCPSCRKELRGSEAEQLNHNFECISCEDLRWDAAYELKCELLSLEAM